MELLAGFKFDLDLDSAFRLVGWSRFKVDLTLGAPDLYPIRTATENELSAKSQCWSPCPYRCHFRCCGPAPPLTLCCIRLPLVRSPKINYLGSRRNEGGLRLAGYYVYCAPYIIYLIGSGVLRKCVGLAIP